MKRILVALVVCLLVAPAAEAHTTLSQLLLKALLSDIVLAPPSGPFTSHEAHFQPVIRPGEVAPGFEINQLEIPLAINSMIASQLATVPLGSSSGGFAYTFDPALGTFSRQSSTFGSAFVERALTAGRGRWNAGFNFQRAVYDSLEGKNLKNGDIRVYLVHQDCCGAVNQAGQPPVLQHPPAGLPGQLAPEPQVPPAHGAGVLPVVERRIGAPPFVAGSHWG